MTIQCQRIFVTGTDTEIGKTRVSCGLLKAFQRRGERVLGFKPVAAGCELIDGVWKNEDALQLHELSMPEASYSQVNPVAYPEPIAPHIAATKHNDQLTLSYLVDQCETSIASLSPERVIIEGAGGWRVPLNSKETLADLAVALSGGVVLVVGLRLGCLNHALLTAEAIHADGLPLLGWVGNQIDSKMANVEENIATLHERLSAPCLGVVPYAPNGDAEDTANHLRVSSLR